MRDVPESKIILDENGKRIYQIQPYKYVEKTGYITVNSIDELIEFIKEVKYKVIVDAEDMELEIYDGYRE